MRKNLKCALTTYSTGRIRAFQKELVALLELFLPFSIVVCNPLLISKECTPELLTKANFERGEQARRSDIQGQKREGERERAIKRHVKGVQNGLLFLFKTLESQKSFIP